MNLSVSSQCIQCERSFDDTVFSRKMVIIVETYRILLQMHLLLILGTSPQKH